MTARWNSCRGHVILENQRPLPPLPRTEPREDLGGPVPLVECPRPAWVGLLSEVEVLRRVFQTVGRWYRSPCSLFMFLGVDLMCIASLIPLMCQSVTVSTVLTPSQSMTWFSLAECSAKADLNSDVVESFLCCLVKVLVLVAFSDSAWCSFCLIYRGLVVSPI